PVPGDSVRRSLERARQIGRRPGKPGWLRRNGHLLAVAQIAAVLLVALTLVPSPGPVPKPVSPKVEPTVLALSDTTHSMSRVEPRGERRRKAAMQALMIPALRDAEAPPDPNRAGRLMDEARPVPPAPPRRLEEQYTETTRRPTETLRTVTHAPQRAKAGKSP